jgi:hypothetical protein
VRIEATHCAVLRVHPHFDSAAETLLGDTSTAWHGYLTRSLASDLLTKGAGAQQTAPAG